MSIFCIMFLTLTLIFLPLFVTLIIIGALYLFKPSILVNGFIKRIGPKMLPLILRRFVKKFITVDDMNISYIERESTGDNQPTVVFIHGFTAFKYVWIPIIRMLPYTWRIIAIDLPGHGESGFNDELTYHSKEMAKMLHKILVKINVKKIHIVSESLGTLMGGRYVCNNPHMVQSMCMISPAFMHKLREGRLTPIINLFEYGNEVSMEENILFPRDARGFRQLLGFALHNTSLTALLHDKLLEACVDIHCQYYHIFDKILNDIRNANETEQDVLSTIEAFNKSGIPSLVIWGQYDEICHVSGADLMKEHVDNCNVVIVQSGHAASLERAGKCAELINNFINFNHPISHELSRQYH